jgi:outer membrane protein
LFIAGTDFGFMSLIIVEVQTMDVRPRVSLVVAMLLTLAASAGIGQTNSPSLEACVRTALEENPGAEAARFRVLAAEGAQQQARAAYYPMLKTSGTYARTDNAPQAFMMTLNQRDLSFDSDFNNPDDAENLRLSLEARYRLYDGGRRRFGVGAAEAMAEASGAEWRALRNGLVHQVTQGFYGVLQAQAFALVQDESLRSLRESLRVVTERVDAGAAVRSDLLNLEVRVSEAEESLIRASNGVQLAIAALNTSIGSDMVGADGLASMELPDADPPAEASAAGGVDARAELAAVQAGVQARKLGYRRAGRDYVPTVSAFGSADWDSEVSTDFENSYMAGVVAEWDVFTGFQRGGAVAQAKAEWEAARAMEEQTRRQLDLDLTTARLQASEAWGRMQVARKAIAGAGEALRMARERYEQGAVDIVELLTAEVGLSASRMRDVAAKYDYRIALSNVARARGELGEP